MTHQQRKAQTMRDRASKREADRERRARIKAGTWDFPTVARPNLQRRARQFKRRRNGQAVRQDPRILRRNLRFSRPRPRRALLLPRPMSSRQRRPVMSRPRPFAPLRRAHHLRRQCSRLVACPVAALSTKATAILRHRTLPLSRRSRNGARTRKPCWRHWRLRPTSKSGE
jgi:hypothetical protein